MKHQPAQYDNPPSLAHAALPGCTSCRLNVVSAPTCMGIHDHTVFIIICKIGFIWSPGNIIHWGVIQPSGRNKGTVAARQTSQQSASHKICLGRGLHKVLAATRGQRLCISWRGHSHSTTAASHLFSTTIHIPGSAWTSFKSQKGVLLKEFCKQIVKTSS